MVFSDLHLHNWEYGATDLITGNSRLLSQKAEVENLINHCKKNNITRAFFCGDLFHTYGKLSTDVLSVAYHIFRAFKTAGIELHVLHGNHDINVRRVVFPVGGLKSSLTPFENMARIVYKPVILSFDDMYACLIPFTNSSTALKRFLTSIDTPPFSPTKPIYLFLHQGVQGAPVGSGYLIDEILHPSMIPKNITRAFTGHYHSHRDLGKLVIVGSHSQLTWADKGETRGALIVDTETGEYEMFENSLAPKFIEFSMEFLKNAIGMRLQLENEIFGNFIRVTNVDKGFNPEDIKKLRNIITSFGTRHVEFQFKDADPISISGNEIKEFNLDEIVKEFSKNLSERHIAIENQLRGNTYEI